MRKVLFTLTFMFLFVIVGLSQDRQVELNVNVPVKRPGTFTTQDFELGGRVYLPLSDRIVTVADLTFKDASALFLNPTDQITAQGQMWLYLTPLPATDGKSHARPFVFGGIAQSFFTNAPVANVNSTQAKSGFGINFSKPSGFQFIPVFEFTSDDLQADRTVLGKEYAAKFHFFIPLGSSFNLNLSPYLSRTEAPTVPLPIGPVPADIGPEAYSTRYGIKIGFARKF